jgi:CheY-like chemotaxis protein
VSPKSRTARRRILIVEDDWAILEVLKLMLEDEGHIVVTAKHGREAVAIASAKPFDMVVMDISMPHMSGIEVARFLRDRPETADVLIVIHTGLDEHWVRERFSDYDLFLTKATDTDVLVQRIARLFALPPATRAGRATAQVEERFTADDLARAREALREALGVGASSFETKAFVAQLGDEISQLRRIGKTDKDIAVLIGEAIGRELSPALIDDVQ